MCRKTVPSDKYCRTLDSDQKHDGDMHSLLHKNEKVRLPELPLAELNDWCVMCDFTAFWR